MQERGDRLAGRAICGVLTQAAAPARASGATSAVAFAGLLHHSTPAFIGCRRFSRMSPQRYVHPFEDGNGRLHRYLRPPAMSLIEHG